MRQPEVDPYEILGLERGASWDEIQAAFRRLAKKHHPDKNPGDPASEWIFKQVNQAHERLRGIHSVQYEEEEPGSPQHRQPAASDEPEEDATESAKYDPPVDVQSTRPRIGRSEPIEPWELLVGNPPGPGVRRKPELGYFFTEVSHKERAAPWQELRRWGSTLWSRVGETTDPQTEHLSGPALPHHRRSFPMERWKSLVMGAGLLGIWALYLAPVTLLGTVLGLPWWTAALAGLILGEWAGVVISIWGLWLVGVESWWILFLGGAIGGVMWSLLSGLWFLVVGGIASLAPSWIATRRLPARVRRRLRVEPPEPDSERN